MSNDGEYSNESTANHWKSSSRFFRSRFRDVVIKVDEDIYYLDRLPLALKSGYFEKLFTQDYCEKNCDLIEIPLIDTDTFAAAVDIMYGRRLRFAIDADNYVSLLMAMDYLQMDIDLNIYRKRIDFFLWADDVPLNTDVFKLCHYIVDNKTYECLLSVIIPYFAQYFHELQDHDEFLSIPFDLFIQIIAEYKSSTKDYQKQNMFCKICAKWICHDKENRIRHLADLVNTAKNRFQFACEIPPKVLNRHLAAVNEHTSPDMLSRCLYKLLKFGGETCYSTLDGLEIKKDEDKKDEDEKVEDESSDDEYAPPHQSKATHFFPFHSEPKLPTFLQNNSLYDITVKAGEKIYKLHRLVLESKCLYFEELFSKELSEMSAQCEGIPDLPNKDKVYLFDNIESAIFDIVVKDIYIGLKCVEITSDILVRLFKAALFLKNRDLSSSCSYWMQKNSDSISPTDVIEILNLSHGDTEYEYLNKHFLSKYIVDSWPVMEKLPQFAALFEAITLPAETSGQDENKVYLLDEMDQETFKLIINYVYFNRIDFTAHNIVRVLKASEIFKIGKLIEKCVECLQIWPRWSSKKGKEEEELSVADVVEVLNFTRRNTGYEVLSLTYLIKHVLQWPQIDNSLFCSISCDDLENILMSSNFFFDDPLKILDICSKWIVHDAVNRFCLIPRIALVISRNYMTDCDDYVIQNPPDLTSCSEDYVKGKLREFLTATSVLSSPVLGTYNAKLLKAEDPVLIISQKSRSIEILNADGDLITSFYLGKNSPEIGFSRYAEISPLSAAMINDNIFILSTICEKYFFHVYNLSSKKLFSLESDPLMHIMKFRFSSKYTLLNCRNEIYCCHEYGVTLKYIFELNRWMKVSEPELNNAKKIHFASDGNTLYRMFETSQTDTTTSYAMESYDFERNSWVSASNVPELIHSYDRYMNDKESRILHMLVSIENGFASLFKTKLYWFDRQTQIWQNISLPHDSSVEGESFIIARDEADETLYVALLNKFYHFSLSNRSLEFKKKWPLVSHKLIFLTHNYPSYASITAIHKVYHS